MLMMGSVHISDRAEQRALARLGPYKLGPEYADLIMGAITLHLQAQEAAPPMQAAADGADDPS